MHVAASSIGAGTPPAQPVNQRKVRELDQGEPAREFRLAVVCYGGVSLAIYMHGVTREIHSLVKASAKLDADPDRKDNPFRPDETERTYWQALQDLRRDKGVRTSVVVDVISGTSAGGINGVVLAKAVARNQTQTTCVTSGSPTPTSTSSCASQASSRHRPGARTWGSGAHSSGCGSRRAPSGCGRPSMAVACRGGCTRRSAAWPTRQIGTA